MTKTQTPGNRTAQLEAQSLILLLARLVVGGIFLLASVTKIRSPGGFADAVRAFHLLPSNLVLPFSLVLPWLEVLVAVYLVLGFMSRPGALGAILLLAVFIFALVDAIVTGNTSHACGCFGGGSENSVLAFLAGGTTVTWWDVIRDVILALAAAPVVWRGPGMLSVDEMFARRHERRSYSEPA